MVVWAFSIYDILQTVSWENRLVVFRLTRKTDVLSQMLPGNAKACTPQGSVHYSLILFKCRRNKIGDGEASSRSNLRRLGRARVWICDRFSAVDRSQKASKPEEESYFWWSDFGIHFRRFWLFFSPSVRLSVIPAQLSDSLECLKDHRGRVAFRSILHTPHPAESNLAQLVWTFGSGPRDPGSNPVGDVFSYFFDFFGLLVGVK